MILSAIGQWARTGGSVLLLFVLYEGFWLLPEKLVVPFPGMLRLSDLFSVTFPLFALVCCRSVFTAFRSYPKASALIIGACCLVLLNPLLAHFFFEQEYFSGLLLVRHNFNYLSFFVFVFLLKDMEGVNHLIKVMSIIVGIYIIILIITKIDPNIGLVNFREGYYEDGRMVRFDDYRLFFPYADVYIFFYFIALCRIIEPSAGDTFIKKIEITLFLIVVISGVYLSYTRMLLLSAGVSTIYAFFFCNKLFVRLISIVIFLMLVAIISIRIFSSPYNSRAIVDVVNIGAESGRKMQVEMYVKQFLRSPIAGVGTIMNDRYRGSFMARDMMLTYKKYGFFNAVDTGYPKIAGEYGLLGLVWVFCFFLYVYRSSKKTLTGAMMRGSHPNIQWIARGQLCFLVYLVVSSLTIPHFVYTDGINILALSLAITAITYKSAVQREPAIVSRAAA